MNTIRMTTAQALVKFMNQQYVAFDGIEQKFIHGIFTIFGHGNVVGLGQALEERAGDLIVHQEQIDDLEEQARQEIEDLKTTWNERIDDLEEIERNNFV